MKVLYILGSARCGSTVLSNILGEMPGVFSAGEIRFLWERAARGRECGCGQPASSCEVWSRALMAGEQVGGSPATGDPIAWQREAVKLRHTWGILRGGSTSSSLRNYLGSMGAVLADIAASQGSEVIVDASKRPSNGAALTRVPGITPYFLHLVRDPRAVAYSRSKPKPGPGGGLAKRSLWDSVLHWNATNAAGDAVRRAAPERSLLLRYEDLVQEPVSAVASIIRLIGLDADPPIDAAGKVELHGNHNVSGNPDRFVKGEVTLRSDDRWLAAMAPWARWFVSAGTAPLMRRYGYPLADPADRSVVAT
jgi:hypothetical protein